MKSRKTLIIAEAGVNHNGSIVIAKKLVNVAIKAKVDFIKFQIFKAEELATVSAPKAKYQLKNGSKKDSHYAMLKKLELSDIEFIKLNEYCRLKKIKFLASIFSESSIQLLKKLKVKYIKIPSGEITNLPLLEKIGKMNKILFMSTGMSKMSEIQNALKVLLSSGTSKKNIYVMHCNTEYPTPIEDVNLKAMVAIKKKFNIKVGFSDHSEGNEASIAASALGAEVIEKHITLNNKMLGPDHAASMEPDKFKEFVLALDKTNKLLGIESKIITKSEKKNIKIARKSLYARKIIQKGELFSEDNLIALRPNVGISPMKIKQLIGKKSKYSISKNELIK